MRVEPRKLLLGWSAVPKPYVVDELALALIEPIGLKPASTRDHSPTGLLGSLVLWLRPDDIAPDQTALLDELVRFQAGGRAFTDVRGAEHAEQLDQVINRLAIESVPCVKSVGIKDTVAVSFGCSSNRLRAMR
jgi:hypothetical protein